jgi:hypothetical protein
MAKSARELTVVTLIIAAIAMAILTARLLSHMVDHPHSRLTAPTARH